MLLHLPAIFAGLIIPGLLFGRAVLGAMVLCFLLSMMARRETRTYFGKAAGIMRCNWIWWCLPVAASLPSLAGSVDMGESAQTILRSVIMIYAAVVLYAWLKEDDRAWAIFCHSILFASLAAVAIGIFTMYEPRPLAELIGKWSPLQEQYTEKRILIIKHATYALGVLLPILAWPSKQQNPFSWLLSVAVALAGIYLCYITQNISLVIGAMLGTATIIIIKLTLFLPRTRWRALFLAILAVTVIGATWQTVSTMSEHHRRPERAVLDLPEPVVDYHRQMIWKYVWETGMRRPFTGWGVNALNKLPETDERESVYDQPKLPGHPHNFLLEIFSETGLIGTIPLLALFFWWLGRQIWLLCLGDLARLQMATLVVAAVILPPAFVAYSIWSPWWMLSICLVIAMAQVIDRRRVIAA